LDPSDFSLVPDTRNFWVAYTFKSDEEVKGAVQQWLNRLAAESCDEGIQKLVTCCDKCLNSYNKTN